MSLIIGFLTFVLVVNCLFLMLLILIQLPKKEAGVGIAFGGTAADALFGAGSGNALTKLTKYSGGAFLGLSLLLAWMNSYRAHQAGGILQRELQNRAAAAAPSGLVPLPTPAVALPASTNMAPQPAGDSQARPSDAGGVTPAPAPGAAPAPQAAPLPGGSTSAPPPAGR